MWFSVKLIAPVLCRNRGFKGMKKFLWTSEQV